MKENSRKEDIRILEEMIENANIENMDMNDCFGGEHIEAIEHILPDYKRVLKENEEYKRIAEINLKNAEEFKNNMCEHRCLLKSENKEQKELIEKMKKYLLKENKMCDFFESEE